MARDDHNTRSDIEVLTFGCRLNAYESEIMKDQAKAAGLASLEDGTILVNTCAVTAEAVRQARQAIRKARRQNPDARIIVSGCAAQTEPATFGDMPEVDLVIGNHDKLKASAYRALPDFGVNSTEKVRVNDIMSVRETAGHMVDTMDGRSRAFIQVQNGCDHRCTFCIIPFGRGNSRSVPAGAVVEQVKRLVDNGFLEIVLTGVDTTSWGNDLPGQPKLGMLVRSILDRVPDLPRLRLSSIDSIEVDEVLADVIATERRFMPHLHLSLQHGDDLILKRMKRRHSREDSIRFCEEIRSRRPDIIFGADLIAGFPTETDAMFENTLSIIEACDLTHLHVFPFSPREGTPAARMPQLERSTIKQRAALLRQRGDAAFQQHLRSLEGRTVNVLVERNSSGHSEQFTPVRIEGSVEINAGIVSTRIIGQDGRTAIGHSAVMNSDAANPAMLGAA
ncbi:MAG: tRNA (N(6)-L-threonylcarbamoyladenosine(37)-C(2))-methylthiotransferase MtaB [Pseudomonadota bacterium]